MTETADEHRYAWRMIRAARRAHAGDGHPLAANDVAALLDQAMEAGLDKAELITALADLGGRLLLRCDPVALSAAGLRRSATAAADASPPWWTGP